MGRAFGKGPLLGVVQVLIELLEKLGELLIGWYVKSVSQATHLFYYAEGANVLLD